MRDALSKRRRMGSTLAAALTALIALASCSSISPDGPRAQRTGTSHEIGSPLTDQDLAAWNIDVAPLGATSMFQARTSSRPNAQRATAHKVRVAWAIHWSGDWAR
jgi:hypothetical protein